MASENEIKNLIKQIAFQNDKAAFSRFFNLYHARLIRVALIFVYSYKDAEDVVSEVMIKLLKQRKKLLEIKNFNGYLFSAVKNQAINLNKKRVARPRLILENIPEDLLSDSYVQPLELMLGEELRDIIIDIVEKLPPQRRIVYKMIKDDGLKIKEVADLLNIAEKTVKKHLELALKDLRKTIEEYYSEKVSLTPVYKIS